MSDLQANIRQFCADHNLVMNTDLGQHFLVDQHVLDAIIDASSIEESDHIVEIGPGVGVLTKELLAKSDKVTAIELDDRMLPLIQKYCAQPIAQSSKLSLINCNALQVDMPNSAYKIVANIPYHITSPLLRHVYLESDVRPTSMTLLIQKEVADRICDPKDAGLLTIIVGLFGKAHKVVDVPPSSFLPPPKVDSAVIHIESYKEPIADNLTIEEVMKLAKVGFSQKRKMLSNSFATFPGGIERLEAAGIDQTRRPQTLSIDEWIAVAKAT